MVAAKRKIETVDLTDDKSHPFSGANKSAKCTTSSEDYRWGSTRPLPSPPSSSQPTSSQAGTGRWGASTQELEEDVRREIDLTQDLDDDVYEEYELYGILNTKVVGIRYYDGRATVGEYVKVRREPQNPYDRNAIRIDNVMGDQIGHIGRQVASKLAGLMDSRSLLVEGALTGRKGDFDAPIALKLFGTNDPGEAAALREQMESLHLPTNDLVKSEAERRKKAKAMAEQQKAREKAAAAMRTGGTQVYDAEGPNRYANFARPGGLKQGPGMDELLSGTATSNPRDVQDVVNQLGANEKVLSKMGLADQPAPIATKLLPYQRQGLLWMLQQESPQLPQPGTKDVVQLWKHVGGAYMNIATSFAVNKPPELASGGILADDMGLGKTLQILSLIMADPQRTPGQPSLIVAPLGVMSNWSSQALTHIKKKYSPRVLTYHGQDKRGMSPQDLQEYDIVITTYQTMALELYPYGKTTAQTVPAKNGLYSLTWRRIVLDEGHNIRNPKAKMSQAACAILAKSRWLLTGTPIVNSLKDLYSHVKFLRLSGGLAEFDIFNGTLIRPLKTGDDGARMLLRAVMSSLSLRRTKDMKFIDLKLPKLEFHQYTVKFLPHEQERYDAFRAEAKGLVESAKAQKGDNTMTHLLEVLLRLRQTCNHWKMCGEERVNKLLALLEENKLVDVMDPANRRALQDLLQIRVDSQEDCPVCMDTFRSPVITACAHAFCAECIEKVIETQKKCPMCRQALTDNSSLIQPAAGLGEGESEQMSLIDADASSSKIEALMKLLRASVEEGSKTVVFSQWTSFLDLVQSQLLKHGLVFTRLDGKMTAVKRDAAVDCLTNDDDCKIMLASLSVCSVGLNLVAANRVILADSWWAPAIESQAVDRVFRLGQTRDCKVVRLMMEDTIEEEVLEIQAKKKKLASMAFGEKNADRRRGQERAQRLQDIERLLR